MTETTPKKLPIAVLISGTGRSLNNLIHLINQDKLDCEIKIVIASTKSASGIQYAEKAMIPIEIIERSYYESSEGFSEAVFQECALAGVELVVLAGYLKLLHVPERYHNKVVNIHPSLVPSFSGKGFYGHKVHDAALEHGVRVTGCTVHFVDNDYDRGPVILQRIVPVYDTDDTQTLNDRVFYDAECKAYPEAIQLLAEGRIKVEGRKVHILPPVDKSRPREEGVFDGQQPSSPPQTRGLNSEDELPHQFG